MIAYRYSRQESRVAPQRNTTRYLGQLLTVPLFLPKRLPLLAHTCPAVHLHVHPPNMQGGVHDKGAEPDRTVLTNESPTPAAGDMSPSVLKP